MVGHDYALIKIATQQDNFSFLRLGGSDEIETGGDATIIGFPFSAIAPEGGQIKTKFCLSATFAATDSVVIPVQGTRPTPAGQMPFNLDIKTDVVYFQGPSVKGISGSPIIARNTGDVVGIVSTKLTGIGRELGLLRDQAMGSAKVFPGAKVAGIDTAKFTIETVNTLDTQLANGLGSAVAIDDAKQALKKAQRKK
jgi:hypothetical protein